MRDVRREGNKESQKWIERAGKKPKSKEKVDKEIQRTVVDEEQRENKNRWKTKGDKEKTEKQRKQKRQENKQK